MILTNNDRVSSFYFWIQDIDLLNDDWNEIPIKFPDYNGFDSSYITKRMNTIILGRAMSISAASAGFP